MKARTEMGMAEVEALSQTPAALMRELLQVILRILIETFNR